jgi:hypothetical protein
MHSKFINNNDDVPSHLALFHFHLLHMLQRCKVSPRNGEKRCFSFGVTFYKKKRRGQGRLNKLNGKSTGGEKRRSENGQGFVKKKLDCTLHAT